jgi:hypothetical protein
MDLAVVDEPAAHVFQNARHRLEPHVGSLTLHRPIGLVLFWVVDDPRPSEVKKQIPAKYYGLDRDE